MADAIEGLRREGYQLDDMLLLVKMARSTFYYHRGLLKSPDKWSDVREKVLTIYRQHEGRYGYRRITKALEDDYGLIVNHKTVSRLMLELKIKSMVRVKKFKSYKGEVGKIAPNILKRDFSTTAFNQKWVTDVTEFHLLGAKVYLSPAIDLHNGEVIGFSISDSPSYKMVSAMLDDVLSKHHDAKGVILHSDQGSVYQSVKYQKRLVAAGIVQSMSRRGNCYDNACAESFFSHLKAEFSNISTFDSVTEFKAELKKYIKYYNENRILTRLGTSPVKYRKITSNQTNQTNSYI